MQLTYGFSAHRAGELKLVDCDIAVLGQQFISLLLVCVLNKWNISQSITLEGTNLHICNISAKTVLVEEVKTFSFSDLVQFLQAEQADDTPEENSIKTSF